MREKLSENEYLIKLFDLSVRKDTEVDETQSIDQKVEIIKRKYPDFLKGYKCYCEKEYDKSDFESGEYVDLRESLFFYSNKNCGKGNFCEFWFIMPDLRSFLLKQIVPYTLIENGNSNRVVTNNMVLPIIIRALGVESAEYFITEFYEKDDGESEEFLVTPSFLGEGEEIIHIEDICPEEEMEITNLEELIDSFFRLRHYPSEQIEKLKQDLIKQLFLNKVFHNSDENNGNIGIIIDEKRNVRMAPMYDFDYFCGNTKIGLKVRKLVNGNKQFKGFIEHYTKFEWFNDWLINNFLSIDFDKLDFDDRKANPNKQLILKENLEFYRKYFEDRKKEVEIFIGNAKRIEDEEK